MKICRKCGKKTNNDLDLICGYCEGPLKTIKSNPFTEKRYGMFNIRPDMLEVFYDEIMDLLKDVFIVKCEYMYATNLFIYTGVSKHFEAQINQGAIVPYSLIYDEDIYKYTFRKAGGV